MSASGRTKHATKITVYLTPDELARLDKLVCHLKHDRGVKTDRSRLVREALDLARTDVARGVQSVLIKRWGASA